MRVFSEQGGEYICSLFGHCTTPQPKGPIAVKAGSSVSVSIVNPFTKTMQFSMNMDNPSFTVKPTELSISGRKSSTVTISYKSGTTGLTTGKLTVISDDSQTSWIYYLRGQN